MSPTAVSPTTNGTNATKGMTKPSIPPRLFSTSKPPSLSDFQTLTSKTTFSSTYPLSDTITHNIPIYDLSKFSSSVTSSTTTSQLQDEWNHILLSGPGVFMLRNFLPDPELLSHVNEIYSSIISSESTSSGQKGDHFAASGRNKRIWNSFQKHALLDASSFVSYYSNPWLRHVSECWLGPHYQITAQVNIVLPGGKPQVSHRDYHLGFQSASSCSLFPRSAQVASQFLTLQGAVAHSDMPLDSGPTRFLPFSQMFEEGYMAYRLPEFVGYFDQHWVSADLKMGDAVFFNPALFHAAGENLTSDIERSANLLQVSSAFGKTMETIDTISIVERTWDEVVKLFERNGKSIEGEVEAVVYAIASGYPFPTNLDRRPPAPGGMAPESEVDICLKGLQEGWNKEKVVDALKQIREDSLS